MTKIAALIDAYSRGPDLLEEALRGVAAADWDARPITGAWSIREAACHLADSEIVYADRMKRVLAEDNPTFFEADPDLFAAALCCSQRPLDGELALIRAIRAHMLPILKACDEAAWRRIGTHSIAGPLTLQALLENVTNHIPHHVAFIEQKARALAG